MITEPFCTPDIYDEQNPKSLLYASDCGGFVSGAIFFPALLICANYVVLNLFVGMIMNNFAYINCKDSNGAIEPADLQNISKIWLTSIHSSISETPRAPLETPKSRSIDPVDVSELPAGG